MRNLALVFGGLLVISGIISVNLWRELRAERQVISELRAQLQEQPDRFASAPLPTPGPQAAPEATRPAAAAVAVSPSPAGARNNGPQSAAQARNSLVDALAQQRDLLKDPEYRRARLEQLRMNMPQNYPDLAEELNLAPDQIDALFNLLAEHQLSQSEVMTPVTQLGDTPDPQVVQEYTRRMQDLVRERDEKVGALLGTAARERFTAYEQTRGARTQARSMQRQLEDSGMPPLRPEQSRALKDAYISAQQGQREFLQQRAPAVLNNPAEALNIQMEMQAERNRSLLESVRPHFTPQQLERLQASLDQQLAMARASMRLSRERLEAQQQAGQENRSAVIQSAPITAAPAF